MPPHYNEQQAQHHHHRRHHQHHQESCHTYGTILPSWLHNKDLLCVSGGSSQIATEAVGTTTTMNSLPPFSCAVQHDDEAQKPNYQSKYERAIENAFAKLQDDHHLAAKWTNLKPNRNTSKSKKKPRRNVKFFPEVVIFTIPNVSALTQEEFSSMYMSRAEMTNIHREAWKMVDLMNLGIEYEDVDPADDMEQNGGFSKRGLEDLKTVNVERRRRMRENAYKVVFGVQAFHNGKQPMDCMDGDEVLGDLYQRVAAPARADAHRVAIADAKEAGYLVY